jgi:N utilization substance protein B
MTRTAARQIAIQLSFAAAASGGDAQEVCDSFFDREHYRTLSEENKLFTDYPDEKQLEYIRTLTALISEHREELDGYIEKYSRGWKTERISRTAAAVLRCAMCEIKYMDEVPDAAAINEAVELAKSYDEPETVSFINGILGSFVKGEVEGAAAEDGQ